MPPSTRDLLAAVLGERPQPPERSVPPAAEAARPFPPAQASPPVAGHAPAVRAASLEVHRPGPWRVTAQVSGGQVQISNHCESRVVPKEQVEVYLRGHGPARAPV